MSARVDPRNSSFSDVMETLESHGHCSALIKLTTPAPPTPPMPPYVQLFDEQSTSVQPHNDGADGDGDGESSGHSESPSPSPPAESSAAPQELFIGHATWSWYGTMHRMFKCYRLPFANVSATAVTFPSYPGALSSLDDFYQTMESRLVVADTSNGIANASVYEHVDSAALPPWQRAQIANRLARDGQQWTAFFGQHNSGTSNSQWMSVHTKRIHTAHVHPRARERPVRTWKPTAGIRECVRSCVSCECAAPQDPGLPSFHRD